MLFGAARMPEDTYVCEQEMPTLKMAASKRARNSFGNGTPQGKAGVAPVGMVPLCKLGIISSRLGGADKSAQASLAHSSAPL